MLEEWIGNVKHFYHKVDFRNTSEYNVDDASTPYEWTNMHYSNVVVLRQEALDKAREVWADYLMVRLHVWCLEILTCVLGTLGPIMSVWVIKMS